MGRIRVVALAVVLLAGASACGKKKSAAHRYDRSTPQAALAALFESLNAGRFAGEIDALIAPGPERDKWRFRCEQRGCAGGEYTIVEGGTAAGGAGTATLFIDFKVRSRSGAFLMNGAGSPVTFEQRGKDWWVVQVGTMTSGTPSSETADAGAAATPAADAPAPTPAPTPTPDAATAPPPGPGP